MATNILVIDDTAIIRENLKKILVQLGYNVIEAFDGLEGMKIIDNKEIDLVIMDLVMPNKSGLELMLELKNKKNLKKIIMTGQIATEKDAFSELASKYGAKFVLHKPFRKRELIEAVEKTLKDTAGIK
jgi:DNA-binding response OmpR family regulator